MGQIFISAGHGGPENGVIDQGMVVAGTTEAQEMMKIRDLVVPELRSRGFTVLSVPDDQSASQTISWINSRSRPGDVALEIHAGVASSPIPRGAAVFYIANNDVREAHAELVLLALLRRVPQLPSRGAQPDTATGTGKLAFCRQVTPPSLLMEVGYITNPDDLFLMQNRRRDIALGIADGLASWSRAVEGNTEPGGTYPEINININGSLYPEKGIIVSNNAYIPIDLVDQLGVDLTDKSDVRRISYRNIVYVKAIDLREYNISVNWDASTRTVLLKSPSMLAICPGYFDRIMGHGKTTDLQLQLFLQSNYDQGLTPFPDLPKIYREEAAIEGVNYDVAFCQMCVETDYLRFSGDLRPEQNNFGGLGTVGGGPEGATFPNPRTGVRAQIQHLKAYASTEPLVQQLVDPRFYFVTRGIAPLVGQLTNRWSADPNYGEKILSTMRRLYESANLM